MIERRKGTIQRQRINPNLLNPEFKIDERSFEDLLAYIVAYVEQINFFTTENRIDGNWKTIVEQDPVIYIIGIIKAPINNLQVENATTRETIDILLDWHQKIVDWYRTLLYFKTKNLADKIGNVLSDVLEDKKQRLLTFSEKTPHSSEKNTFDTQEGLDEISHTFRKMILYIQNFASDYLKINVFTQGNHMPNNAMYIAFAIVFGKIQEQMNAIGQRHLDFYYKEILQQTPSKGIPTKTVVCFELAPKSKGILVPNKTPLIAGKLFESKDNVLFETTKPLLVLPIHIEAIQTLYFNHSPFIKIGTNTPIIANIIKNKLVDNRKPVKNIKSHAVFGADKNTIINSDMTQKAPATIGCMIASPVLFLEEGEREIIITFRLDKETSKTSLWKLLDEMTLHQNTPLEIIFNRVFEKAFDISYSTAKGWVAVSHYGIRYDKIANTFTIHFTLARTASPISVLPAEPHSIFPMVKIILEEYAPIYVYSFFKGIMLEAITIDTHVTGLKNLSIYNNVGKMPLTKSFNIFGAVPIIGSFLMVGKSELFKKELTTLDLHIAWANIPYDYGGFETYYKAYSEKFTNDSFIVSITALSNGYWFPTKTSEKTQVSLFDTIATITPEGNDSTILSKTTRIRLHDLGKYGLSRAYQQQDPILYDAHTNTGFFRLSLMAPLYAFGKDQYAKNYKEIATYNAQNEESLPLPNKPFVPKVAQVTLDYSATDTIYFNNAFDDSSESVLGSYTHITPFGTEVVVKNSRVYKNTMFSDFKGIGYLYLKLTKLTTASSVSFFFDLKNDHPENNTEPNNCMIEYKEMGNWVMLPTKQILADGTNQLSTSGIIELLLPINSTNDTTEFELRFVAKKEAYTYPKINGIYTNAVIACCTNDDATVLGKKVEAHTIHKPANRIVGIKKVLQPAASYGGKKPTDPELFYTEVSERLRHKDRALTIWDYERLVLQRFPTIIAVKCTNLDQFFEPQAGKITLIVLSHQWKHDAHHYCSTSELDSIHRFIKGKANSFIKIKVQNPAVEWLLVSCFVTFYKNDQGGYYINDLNTEISDYLCPLSHSDATTIEGIGATVVPRMLRNHIENLSYIQSVKTLEIEHIVQKGLDNFSVNTYQGNQEINTTTPWAILAPKSKHKIYDASILTEETSEEVENENLQIGIDYIIQGDDHTTQNTPTTLTKTGNDSKELAPKTSSKSSTILTFKIK